MTDTLICPPGLAETPVLTFAETVESLHERLSLMLRIHLRDCDDRPMVDAVTEALALCDLLLPAVRKTQREGV